MPTLFTKIIKGEIPSYVVFQNDKVFAFLDIYPKQYGHTLVIPKIEVDNIIDLDKEYYDEVFEIARKIAKALQKITKSSKIAFLVEGLEVPHAHLHLIPINKPGDVYSKPKEFSEDIIKKLQLSIFNYLN